MWYQTAQTIWERAWHDGGAENNWWGINNVTKEKQGQNKLIHKYQ